MQFSLAVLAALVPAIWAQCPSVEFIYARATTEPPQNYGNDFDGAAAQTWSRGYGAAGYSLFTNITALIPDAAGHPVHYPASMGDSMPIGVQDYLSHLGETAQRCPDTKFALGGHSQGGMVTVQVIPQIPANILSRVISVTMFGSPACPTQVSGRCMSYCHSGDFVSDSA
ncbi:alpha/beta-hydrolase, partial [Eremomyces bilateralis CBS 781.70]